MAAYIKEACHEVYIEPKVFGISKVYEGISKADMEAIFGRLGRSDTVRSIYEDENVESDDIERTKVFNFTEFPLSKITQDGARMSIMNHPILEYISSNKNAFAGGMVLPLWWSAIAKTQENIKELDGKIIVTRLRIFTGQSLADIRNQVRNSRISEEAVTQLMQSKTFKAYYGGKYKTAIYAMFVYVIPVSEFNMYKHLHERCSDTFVSLENTLLAPAHPNDSCNLLMDFRSMGDDVHFRQGIPVTTYRYVYHLDMPRVRYIREGTTVVELVPEKDLTTEPGFYRMHYVPCQSDGRPGRVIRNFTKQSEIEEENGYYLSREGAEKATPEKDLQAERKKNQQDLENYLKNFNNTLTQDAKNSAIFYKDYLKECTSILKEASDKRNSDHQAALSKFTQEKKLLEEQLAKARDEADQRRREHDEYMLERKELLETLRLIPVLVTTVATIFALGKKSKKK